jgi:hypothetical protein
MTRYGSSSPPRNRPPSQSSSCTTTRLFSSHHRKTQNTTFATHCFFSPSLLLCNLVYGTPAAPRSPDPPPFCLLACPPAFLSPHDRCSRDNAPRCRAGPQLLHAPPLMPTRRGRRTGGGVVGGGGEGGAGLPENDRSVDRLPGGADAMLRGGR